ncbi:hypothetical protein SLEP1_g10416 [Rubroshorea leprosula]|uniref:AP2/ERF domain-containing protein n=1 Tax=Rubroshorea leprosula TaxID=152421 RepID=A0AAV5IHH0_9ROSI|nr:hypothetical protein SLEP1_g10416 [Rubroshorea leprosula]
MGSPRFGHRALDRSVCSARSLSARLRSATEFIIKQAYTCTFGQTRGLQATWDEMVKEVAAATALGGAKRARKQFVGVRQRPSGRWVAEIKDTIQKIRVWLGTYDTAEEAARAYDEAGCILCGANTRTNFWPCSPASNPTPALPSKITSLLLQSIFNGYYISNTTANASNYLTTSLESCLTKKANSSGRDLGLDYCNFSDAAQSSRCDDIVEEGLDMEALDFHFVDDNGSSSYYSPFEMAEEIEGPVEAENFSNKPSVLRAAMKRMKYERKFSTSFYAFNGIPECLRLRLELENVKGGRVKAELSIQSLEDKKGEGNENEVMGKKVEECLDSPSSSVETGSSSSHEGEFCLWSSLDLPTIC